MKPEEAIKIMSEALYNTNNPVSAEAINSAIQALEKQVAKKGKEMTWEVLIKSISRNTYEVEQEILDPSDRSVAMDEMIPVVNQGFILGLLYSIAEGNTIILPPK